MERRSWEDSSPKIDKRYNRRESMADNLERDHSDPVLALRAATRARNRTGPGRAAGRAYDPGRHRRPRRRPPSGRSSRSSCASDAKSANRSAETTGSATLRSGNRRGDLRIMRRTRTVRGARQQGKRSISMRNVMRLTVNIQHLHLQRSALTTATSVGMLGTLSSETASGRCRATKLILNSE